jgi:hypothetical protein
VHWEGCETEEDTWEEAAALGRYSQFTYFTSTKVQKLTSEAAAPGRYSQVYIS